MGVKILVATACGRKKKARYRRGCPCILAWVERLVLKGGNKKRE